MSSNPGRVMRSGLSTTRLVRMHDVMAGHVERGAASGPSR